MSEASTQPPISTGTPRSLSGFLANGPVVLFFYPAAMTYGCTKESCHFRDLGAEFAALGAQRVGISAKSKCTSEKSGSWAVRWKLNVICG